MAPSDGCPYHRPFDEYFLECPNYQREPFAAQNLRGAPLATVWTCRHLTIGEADGTRGPPYASGRPADLPAPRQAPLANLRGPRPAAGSAKIGGPHPCHPLSG